MFWSNNVAYDDFPVRTNNRKRSSLLATYFPPISLFHFATRGNTVSALTSFRVTRLASTDRRPSLGALARTDEKKIAETKSEWSKGDA